ncbi:MAG: ATP synthase F0 subunit B [Ilumatobacter sp.]|nr:ATP synthase F0 subunit B [Ilumatobacter sp.]
MLTAVVTTSHTGSVAQVNLIEADTCERTDLPEGENIFPVGSEMCPELIPIAPEGKEVIWGFGAFVVLAIALRYVLFPKVRAGMTARYDSIQGDFEKAETLTASARAEVAEYDAQVASVRADAQGRVDAARATLEGERNERLTAVNASIAEKRAAAAAEVEAARQAASSQVAAAVSDVAARAGELAAGKAPSADVVAAAVDAAMGANV